jgi:hypothetical protein
VPAIVKCERGDVYLPAEEPPWLAEFMLELASFTGGNDPADDQVDALAYSVLSAQHFPVRVEQPPCVLLPARPNPLAGKPAYPTPQVGALGYGQEYFSASPFDDRTDGWIYHA